MDQLYSKALGENNYKSIKINRSKGKEKRSWKSKLGNTISHKASRPRAHTGKASNRVFDKTYHNAIEKYNVTDVVPAQLIFSLKSVNSVIISTVTDLNDKRNPQNEEKIQHKVFFKDVSRIVCLSNIHNGLYIGNLRASEYYDNLQNYRIKTIINCSDQKINLGGINVIDIDYDDTLNISHKLFRNIIDKAVGMLDMELSKGNVLVLCNKGVNRSPSIAIAYAVLKTNNFASANDAIEYVDQKKMATDKNWNNLTNNRIRGLLRSLKS